MNYRGKTGMSLENVQHIHNKKLAWGKEDWQFQEHYRLQAGISKIMKYSRWGFISYHSIYLVQRETGKDTSVRFSTTTECINRTHNETKCRECYWGQFAVDANLDGITHHGVYLNNLVFEWWKHKEKGRKPEQVSGLSWLKYTDFEISHEECVLVTPVTAVWRGKKKARRKRIIKSQESIV